MQWIYLGVEDEADGDHANKDIHNNTLAAIDIISLDGYTTIK
jgi:hypothetical protein